MKSILTVVLGLIAQFTFPQAHQVQISFNKNVELFGYIIELGDPSTNDTAHPISQAIHEWPEDSRHPRLMEIFELAGEMDYGMLVELFYSLPPFPMQNTDELTGIIMQKFPDSSMENLQVLFKLTQKVHQFAATSHFEDIWTALSPYRAETLKAIHQMKLFEPMLSRMHEFYGTSFESYQIIPSLTIWTGPGWGIRDYKNNCAIMILGPVKPNYSFEDDSLLALSIHEFGHAFVNPVVLQNEDILEKSNRLFLKISSEMKPQGYANWETCVTEHFVRAGEFIIPPLMESLNEQPSALRDYIDNRKFIYLPFIIEKLKYYRLKKGVPFPHAVRKTLLDLEKTFN